MTTLHSEDERPGSALRLKAGELSAAATGTVDPAWGHLHVQSQV